MIKRYVFAVTLVLALVAVLVPNARGAQPDPAANVPADAVAFFSVKDIRPLIPAAVETLGSFDPARAELIQSCLGDLGQVAAGRLAVAIMPPDEERDTTFFLTLPVDESKLKIDDFIQKDITQLVGEKNVESSEADGIRELKSTRGRGRLCWAVRDGVLYCSNERSYVANILKPPAEPAPSLADTDNYKRLGKHVDWSADITAYADLEAVLWPTWRHRFAEGELGAYLGDMQWEFGWVTPDDLGVGFPVQWLYEWLSPEQFSAVGASWPGNGKTGSGRVAVLTPEERTGVAALLDMPNAPVEHLDRIPEDCQLFASCSPVTRDLVPRLARFMSELDPEIAQEFQDELAEFNKELGVDLGKDLCGVLGSVTAASRLPNNGSAINYCVIGVTDAERVQKCIEALANYNQTPVAPFEPAGRSYHTLRAYRLQREDSTIHILPMEPVAYYVFDDGAAYCSDTPEALDEMLALKKGGRTLADSETFKALRARLPEECMMLWAGDTRCKADDAVNALEAFLALCDKGVPKPLLNKFFAALQNAPEGLNLGIALRNEPDAFVLHIARLRRDAAKPDNQVQENNRPEQQKEHRD